MYPQELGLVKHYAEMRSLYGVFGIKMEFEVQWATFNDGVRLTLIARDAGLVGVTIKIGGPAAYYDLQLAFELDARWVVAPLVDDPHKMIEFLEGYHWVIPDSAKSEIRPAVNIETKLAYEALDEVLSVGRQHGLRGVTLGRVDMAKSFWGEEKGRGMIDSSEMLEISKEVCRKARLAGVRVTIGGGIEEGSRENLERLTLIGDLDCFETRMVQFPARLDLVRDHKQYAAAIRASHQIEDEWLAVKEMYGEHLVSRHRGRREMLRKRLQQ